MEGKTIKQKLLELGIAQLELANKLGTTPQSLSSILHAKDVRSGTIEKIASALNLPLSYFYGETEIGTHAIATGNKAVAAVNSTITDLPQSVQVLEERVKSLENLIQEKERLIKVYERLLDGGGSGSLSGKRGSPLT